jgi:MOSC domain-containing protein YiiM
MLVMWSPEILKCVVQKHGQSAGIYATVLTPGEVRAGTVTATSGNVSKATTININVNYLRLKLRVMPRDCALLTN